VRTQPIRLVISPNKCRQLSSLCRTKLKVELTEEPVDQERQGQSLAASQLDVLDHLRKLSAQPTSDCGVSHDRGDQHPSIGARHRATLASGS